MGFVWSLEGREQMVLGLNGSREDLLATLKELMKTLKCNARVQQISWYFFEKILVAKNFKFKKIMSVEEVHWSRIISENIYRTCLL